MRCSMMSSQVHLGNNFFWFFYWELSQSNRPERIKNLQIGLRKQKKRPSGRRRAYSLLSAVTQSSTSSSLSLCWLFSFYAFLGSEMGKNVPKDLKSLWLLHHRHYHQKALVSQWSHTRQYKEWPEATFLFRAVVTFHSLKLNGLASCKAFGDR